ncbi:MAG TPA: DNA-binding response regulator [Marinilabiliales bacterium]|jgi:DNA-binding LytR/AlgR family response regulator|nr:DNA-binding response regulator [Marinilabiliales bacterium]
MNTIRCIAVDDEPLALTIISEYARKVPFISLEKVFTNATDALMYLQTEKPELVFLDIQMPEIKGIDLARIIQWKTAIIFTTAYSQYAVESYSLDAIDYLLKPVPFERFLQAVNKAAHYLQNEKITSSSDERNFLFVKSGYKAVKINFDDIFYIEGLKEYVTIFAKSQKVLKLDTLKNLEQLLPKNHFVRVHKSYIVNLNYVKASFGNTIEINDKQIPVGRAYKEVVKMLLKI